MGTDSAKEGGPAKDIATATDPSWRLRSTLKVDSRVHKMRHVLTERALGWAGLAVAANQCRASARQVWS